MNDIDQRPAGAPAHPVAPMPPAAPAVPPAPMPAAVRSDLEQLSRIEDKAARIEEKYARSEALLLRVEQAVQTAALQMGGNAKREDLAALRGAIRRKPGYFGLVVVALLTAVGTAALTYYLTKYGLPGLPGLPGGPQPS